MPRLPTLHTAAANGRVEEAMDPSPALNQPPLAISPPDVVNRRAGTCSLAIPQAAIRPTGLRPSVDLLTGTLI